MSRRSRNAAKTIFLTLILFYILFYLNLCLYNTFDNTHNSETSTLLKTFNPNRTQQSFWKSLQDSFATPELNDQLSSSFSKSKANISSYKNDNSIIVGNKPRDDFKNYDNLVLSQENRVNISSLKADALTYTRCIEEFKYFYRVAIMHNVIIDPNECERTDTNRREFYAFRHDFMTMLCMNHMPAKRTIHQTKYFSSNLIASKEFLAKLAETKNYAFQWLIAIVREEYANAYWTVMDVFDLYHIIKALDKSYVQILWLDAHPKTNMDQLWQIYFGNVLYLPDLKEHKTVNRNNDKIFAENFIFRPDRQWSIFKNKIESDSLAFSEFRNEAYQKVGVRLQPRNCTRLRVTVVWRRNYVNHPGNPLGEIKRKVANEREVIDAMRSYKEFIITEACLEQMTVSDQIRLMSQTDVFFGVHGAGHTMAVFMPPGGAVVEVTTPKKKSNRHMMQLAVNAGQRHILHVLNPTQKEQKSDSSYYISPVSVKSLMQRSKQITCDYD